MTRLLSLFGRKTRACKEPRIVRDPEPHPDSEFLRLGRNQAETDWQAKYKQAVADLEKQAGEIAELKGECVELRRSLRQRTNDLDHIEGQEELSERLIAELRDEIEDLRPDALAMRRKRQMDRDRRKGNG